ncbi:Uncharacterised protein [Escherichia coli]|nr:Uncharacterised protein [Escherichia coli]
MNRSPAVRWQMSSLRTKLSVVNFTWMMLDPTHVIWTQA